MNSVIKYILAASLFFGLSGYSQSAGTTIFEFLKTQYSARSAAMGNNLIAVKGDVNGMFINPAVLAGGTEQQWGLNYVDHLLDFQAGQLSYVRPTQAFGNVGLGLIYFNYGSFDETDIFGDKTGNTFSASEMAFAATIANTLGDGFDYGLNLKYIYSSLEAFNASGLAIDAGLTYSFPYVSDLLFGINISNLGLVLDNYTDADGKMPIYMRFGFAKKLAHLPLLFTASLNDLTLQTEKSADFVKRFSVGGEFDVNQYFKLRIGYDNNINQSVKPLEGSAFAGISAGLGIHWQQFRLDYAFGSYGGLGTQNRLGISGSL